MEQRTGEGVRIRLGMHHQLSWTEGVRGEPDAFIIEPSLDHGAAEYLLHALAADARVLNALLGQTVGPVFDLDRRTLIFGARIIN
jgi:hypothetical protein